MGMGGMGGMTGRGGVVAPVVVDGAEVGSVRLFFGTGHMSAAQQIAWGGSRPPRPWPLLVAVGAAWLVTGRITRPLTRLAGWLRPSPAVSVRLFGARRPCGAGRNRVLGQRLR